MLNSELEHYVAEFALPEFQLALNVVNQVLNLVLLSWLAWQWENCRPTDVAIAEALCHPWMSLGWENMRKLESLAAWQARVTLGVQALEGTGDDSAFIEPNEHLAVFFGLHGRCKCFDQCFLFLSSDLDIVAHP